MFAPLSLNFNYQIKNQPKIFASQTKFAQLMTDTISFKSKEVTNERQKAEELLGQFERLQESRKNDTDWKYSRLDKSVMDKQEMDAIIDSVGAFEDLSKKLLNSCTPNSLYHKDDRTICFEIVKKQPNAAQDFLCKRGFYAKDGKKHMPIYFASTTQEIKDLLSASTSRKVYGLQTSNIDLINKECTRQDCLDLIGLTKKDHELTYMIHRPVGETKGPYSNTYPLFAKLEMGDVISVLDKFEGMIYKSSLLSEMSETIGDYVKQQAEDGCLNSDENCSCILNHVINSINNKDTLPYVKNRLYENCIAPVMAENAQFINDLLAVKVAEGSLSLAEVENLQAYFEYSSSEKE